MAERESTSKGRKGAPLGLVQRGQAGWKRWLDGPVAWFLGRKLLLELKSIVLYTLYGSRLGGTDWMTGQPVQEGTATDDSIWFDYIADTGDSVRATRRIARVCLSDIEALASDGSRVSLPRGRFLVVGGDTGYHVADERTLALRFQAPFNQAAEELAAEGHDPGASPRHLYGLPGNHDYYDGLHGFNRQFRQPAAITGVPTEPYLPIAGLERVQSASYFAVELPSRWLLLGLDTQDGKMDFRQRAFFANLIEKRRREGTLDRLIVATPEPTTVFDQRASKEDPIVVSLGRIGLSTPFLDSMPIIPEGHIRLDLSGNIHQYARYWGPCDTGAPSSAQYASVVCGLGGIFLHPTCTRLGEITAAKMHPDPPDARARTIARLLNPFFIWFGGNVPIVGAVIAAIAFAASQSKGSERFVARAVEGMQHLARGKPPGDAWMPHGPYAPFLAVIGAIVATALAVWFLLRHRARVRRGDREVGRPLHAYALVALACAAPFAGHDFRAHMTMTPSLLVFVYGALGATIASMALWHSEMLAERARARAGAVWRWEGAIGIGLFVAGVALGGSALARFGHVPASTLSVHLWFAFILALCIVGMPLLAVLLGAGRHRWAGKVGFAALGVWHGVLQIGIPAIWTRKGSDVAMLAYLGLALVAWGIGHAVRKLETPWVLLSIWIATGLAGLAWPLWLPDAPKVPGTDWVRLLELAALGAVLSCVWFGWYLSVSLAFNGHNNEAGAGAAIDEYTTMLRIRLSGDELHAYVVAAAQQEGEPPVLVEKFVLSAKRPPLPASIDHGSVLRRAAVRGVP